VIKLWSKSSVGSAPLQKYCGVSITNTIGPTMGIEALKYISYPAQVREFLNLFLLFRCGSHFCLLMKGIIN
jgi:UAA transporter family